MKKKKIEFKVKNDIIKEKNNGKLYTYYQGKELWEYNFSKFIFTRQYLKSNEVNLLLHYFLWNNFPRWKVDLKAIAYNATVFYILKRYDKEREDTLLIKGGDEVCRKRIYYNWYWKYFYWTLVNWEDNDDNPTVRMLSIKEIKELLKEQQSDLWSIVWLWELDTLDERIELLKLLRLK